MKLLVIDDDASSRHLMRKILTQSVDCVVIEAATAWEGLYQIERSEPRVVFIGVQMPGFNGIKLLQAIRQHGRFRTLPVIVVGSSPDAANVRTMVQLQVSGYILKPLVPEIVQEQLARALGEPAAGADELPMPLAASWPIFEPTSQPEPVDATGQTPYGVW